MATYMQGLKLEVSLYLSLYFSKGWVYLTRLGERGGGLGLQVFTDILPGQETVPLTRAMVETGTEWFTPVHRLRSCSHKVCHQVTQT